MLVFFKYPKIAKNGNLLFFPVLGVPQGTVLAPPMFLLFINDIHENLDSTLRLFADDAILYRSIKTMNDSDILQNDIDKFVSWSKTW